MNNEWNDGYYFELLDRTHTVMVLIEELVDQHPALEKIGCQKDIDLVQSTLMKVYQKVGEADFLAAEARGEI
jgi:hypothetical protein